MVYTNPNAISSSGNNKYYTNQRSKIQMLNLNLVNNANDYNNFLVQEFNERQTGSNSNIQTNSKQNNNDFGTILQNQKLATKYGKF